MAQYAEGQKLKGSDGNIYVVRNGVPVRDAGPSPRNNPLAPPGLPLDLRGKEIGIRKGEADLQLTPYQLRKQKAEAEAAEIDTKTKREQYDAQHPKVSDSGLYGEAYLKALSASDRAMIKALDEGRLAFPTGSALRAPFWQEKLSQVSQFDPTFDATDFNARAKARANAIAGKLGNSNNALNTAIGHLGELYQQIGGTASHNFTPLNHIENAASRAMGSPGVTNFEQTAGLVADELEAAYRGGNGAEAGVVRGLRSLDPNMSRAQKEGVIRNAINLLTSKISANVSQYNFGTQGGKPTWDMLDPHTRSVLETVAPGTLDKYFAPPAGHGGQGASGGADYSAMRGNGNMQAVDPNSTTRTEAVPEASAFIDEQIRQGVPYRAALGAFLQRFPDAAAFSPDQYNAALTYAKTHPNENGYGDVTRIVPLSEAEQQNNSFVQSGFGSLVGHAADASLGGIPTALAGDQGAFYRATTNQQHGGLSATGDVLGAVAGTLGLGKGFKVVDTALEDSASPLLQKIGKTFLGTPGRRALASDLTYGGSFGATQNPDDPLAGAAIGAAAMGAGNVAGRYALGPAIGAAGTTRAGQKVAGMFGANPVPRLPAGERMVVSQSGKAVPDILSTLDEASSLNLPFALADANPKLRALAGSATRKSPGVRELAENTLGPRQLGQADRAMSAIDTHLAPSGDLGQINADALTRARAASQPFYEKAMQHPAPDDKALMDMLRTPAGESAAREAYTIALNKGENPAELSFSTAPDGSVRIDATPNWRTLQYMKQGVDAVVEKNRNPVTGKLNLADPAAKGLQDFRAKFTGRLHALNDDFRAADSEFAKFAGQGSAASLGASATAPRVTPETVQGVVGNMPPENLPHYRQGFSSSLADRVENLNYSGDPYKAIYGSPAQRAKIASVFPEGAPRFDRINALEGDMSRTAHETLGGSPTASRLAADQMFENGHAGLAGDLAFSAATGAPTPGLIKSGMGVFAGDAFRMGLGKSAQKKADQLGPILLNTDPAEAADFVRRIMEADKARRAYTAQARAAGGMFGAPLVAPFITNP